MNSAIGRRAKARAVLLDQFLGGLRNDNRRSRFRRHPRRGAQALRGFSRRILAEARPRGRLSRGFCQGAQRRRLPSGPDSGGIRRLGPAALGRGGHSRGGSAGWLQRRRLPCPDVYHGALLRHGSEAQKQAFLPKIAAGDFCACRPSASPSRPAAPTRVPIKTTARCVAATAMWSTARRSGRRGPSTPISCCCLRGRRPRSRWRKRTDGLSIFLLDMQAARSAGAVDPADPDDDEPCDHRGLFRQRRDPGRELVGEEGQGVPLRTLGDECRAHPDCGRMPGRRQMVHRQGRGLWEGARGVRPSDRSEPGHPVPHCQGLCADARR